MKTVELHTDVDNAPWLSNAEKPERIVVVGASAGGVQALSALAKGLPERFPAPILVVLHIPAFADSRLPEILSRRGPLPARHAVDGEELLPGTIYIAPPDLHLRVRNGAIELKRGPRENRSRPAIDPLFRSAARHYGPNAIGIILSGALYDGAAGLLALSSRGGTTIVQEPEDASFDPMPVNALRLVEADHVVPATEIGSILQELVNQPMPRRSQEMSDNEGSTDQIISKDIEEVASDERGDDLTIYTCPDCGGAMWQIQDGLSAHYACHVGHKYNPEYLFAQKTDELEGALWKCVRLLTENAALARQVANRNQAIGEHAMAERMLEQAVQDLANAELIRGLLTSPHSIASRNS